MTTQTLPKPAHRSASHPGHDQIQIVESGLVYRNPSPHLRAIHTWHPTVVLMPSGELIASYDLGEAVESLNYRTYLSRSSDGGKTWSSPLPILGPSPSGPRASTHSLRISHPASANPDQLVGFGGFYYRDQPGEGLTNRDNLGMTPMDVFIIRSDDAGRTWSAPSIIKTALVGPGFEICHPIVELADGRWLAPTSTWRGWDGSEPNGMKAVALVSHDKGETWPDYLDIMDHTAKGFITWEQSLTQLSDGRLVSVAWLFNEKAGHSEPNQYAVSRNGKIFGPARPNGLNGETAKLIRLHDDRLLCLYRRQDAPGLWSQLAQIDGETWVSLADAPIWTGLNSGVFGAGTNSDNLSALKFGYPTMAQLPDGDVIALIWCSEGGINNVRWFRLRITPSTPTHSRSRPKASLSAKDVRSALVGPVNSIPIPFLANGQIDRDGVANIIDSGIANGSAVSLLTAGDSQLRCMTEQEITDLTRLFVERTDNRAMTVAATGLWSTRQAVGFAEFCREIGVDVLMSSIPVDASDPDAIAAHYIAISKILPTMVVGVPSHAVLDRLANVENVCCFKEDATEGYAIQSIQRYSKSLTVMTGGTLWRHLTQMPYGVNAYMDWSVMFAPEVSRRYWESVQKNDFPGAASIIRQYETPFQALAGNAFYPDNSGVGSTSFTGGWQSLWRAALEIKGISKRYLRMPSISATDADVERLRDLMHRLRMV